MAAVDETGNLRSQFLKHFPNETGLNNAIASDPFGNAAKELLDKLVAKTRKKARSISPDLIAAALKGQPVRDAALSSRPGAIKAVTISARKNKASVTAVFADAGNAQRLRALWRIARSLHNVQTLIRSNPDLAQLPSRDLGL